MSQIEELHNRIVSAMERISSGVEVLSRQAAAAVGDDQALREALEEEKLANAQLEERLKALKDRHAAEIDALRAEAGNQDEVRALKAEIEELRLQVEDNSEVEELRAQLAEARAKLENSDETTRLKEEIASLKTELSDSERVAELSAELEMLRAERASHGSAMSRLEHELRQLQKANEQLRDTIAELRASAEAGVTNPELLNRAAEAELEALRAARATDAAEAHAVLARLEPLLAQANLAEGEVE
ncbi:hypothetical protein AVO45_02300 [Ruegeria marisrubri]|uniref:Uncharacterized protein n=1 Tax=Ruegeria marisrubri TaxID=1685379 RepID=A0A117KH53_9RHOB|nr:hypothetical protein [Ruegeria marisrubri]KUJ85831.1 hypothetical protein AVO45_02300 [Ruegeria marisrubri]